MPTWHPRFRPLAQAELSATVMPSVAADSDETKIKAESVKKTFKPRALQDFEG
jgi:hypothetical protein